MPPQRTKRDRNSAANSSKRETSKAVAIQSPDSRTPERNGRQQAPMLTAAQKQALIDNLQLEVTERARKLRAQYALHTQGLRSRLEMRINRIPQTLRSANIGVLIDRYSEHLEPPKPQALQVSKTAPFRTAMSSKTASSSSARRVLKRDSSEMMGQSDKENVQADLDMPKKRARTAAAPTANPRGKAASRQIDPSKVLSPKSHNSRTLPHSPIKTASPGKSGLSRPISPVKPGTVAAATASLASIVNGDKSRTGALSRANSKITTTAGSIRGRVGRAMAPPPPPKQATRGRAASSSSQNSDASAGTTIVRKATVGRKVVAKVTGTTTTTAKRAAVKKEIPAPSSTGTVGRTLRSRR